MMLLKPPSAQADLFR